MVYITSDGSRLRGCLASKMDEKADAEVSGGIALVMERGRWVEKNEAKRRSGDSQLETFRFGNSARSPTLKAEILRGRYARKVHFCWLIRLLKSILLSFPCLSSAGSRPSSFFLQLLGDRNRVVLLRHIFTGRICVGGEAF